ncbi:hypothetical protein FN846DRAFT_903868 [Sphaerosporella brunnea]|uniref:Uncharacterized protein n=1 Tax=Sphaerosporella brunnea TaxID=1250544 RepID=A0A5J5F603_9PEZI|nr:hypothetical protein FN846DRAFT_903868 [Sphaerosporella brunnea]
MAQNNPASPTLTLESLPFHIHVELLVIATLGGTLQHGVRSQGESNPIVSRQPNELSRLGDPGGGWAAYEHILAAEGEYEHPWLDYAVILTTVLGLRFWLAPACTPPALEWSRTLPALGSVAMRTRERTRMACRFTC